MALTFQDVGDELGDLRNKEGRKAEAGGIWGVGGGGLGSCEGKCGRRWGKEIGDDLMSKD